MTKDVGVLVSRWNFDSCLKGRCPYESFALYDIYGKRAGVRPVFFTLDHVNFRDLSVEGRFRTGAGEYRPCRIPIPAVIHNRIRPPTRAVALQLERLRRIGCTTLFNPDTRMDKWTVYRALKEDPRLKDHLPETALLTPESADGFVSRHGSVYVKPRNKSLALGLFRLTLEPAGDAVRVVSPRSKPRQYPLDRWRRLVRRLSSGSRFLVQQAVSLARIERRPVDIRVSVQKNGEGKWAVSGMVARLGPADGVATNVAVGGRAFLLASVLERIGIKPGPIQKQITDVVIRAAERLAETRPGLADLGFDVAIDERGHIWIIEVNGRDLRITFRQAGDWAAWHNTFRRPMEYAAYLVRQGERTGDRISVAVVTPGTPPLSEKRGGSVETAVRETVRRIGQNRTVYVLGRGAGAAKGAVPVEISGWPPRMYLSQVSGQLRRLKPDLIQVENRPHFVPSIRAACPRTPLVLFVHSENFLGPPFITPGGLARSFGMCDAVLTNSRYMVQRLAQRVPASANKLVDVPLGVDPRRFRPPKGDGEREPFREKHGLSGKKVLLFVGRLLPQKGVHLLLEALPAIRERHPDAVLLMVGGTRYGRNVPTPYWRMLRARIEKLGEGVRWIPWVPHSEVPEVYRAADLLVTPSLGSEAFGLVNLEGMATGLPVISVKTGGIPEVVGDGECGILLKSDRVKEELVPACLRLLEDEGVRRRMGRAGRKRVEEHFTWELVARRLSREYERLLETRKHSASV